MTMVLSAILGLITSAWKCVDQSEKKANLYALALSLAGGYIAYGGSINYDSQHAIFVFIATALCFLLLTKDGWEHCRYMLMTRALPCAAFGLVHFIYYESLVIVPFALSGFIVTVVYVEGSRLELSGVTIPLKLTAEKLGRISHGFFVAGLVLV